MKKMIFGLAFLMLSGLLSPGVCGSALSDLAVQQGPKRPERPVEKEKPPAKPERPDPRREGPKRPM